MVNPLLPASKDPKYERISTELWFNFSEFLYALNFLHSDCSGSNDYTMVYPKVSGLSRKDINNTNNNNEHSLRSNTKGYGGKTH